MAAGAAGAFGAGAAGTWPGTAATVADWAPLPEPPRVGKAAPPPGRLAGCQGAVKPQGDAGIGAVAPSVAMKSASSLVEGLTTGGAADCAWGTSGRAPPEPGTTRGGGTIAIASRSRPGSHARGAAEPEEVCHAASAPSCAPNAGVPLRLPPPHCMHVRLARATGRTVRLPVRVLL
jgi:hypothetical protein